MSFWRSRGSSISRSWGAASLVLLMIGALAFSTTRASAASKPPSGKTLEESHEGVTSVIRVTLVGITAFQDFQELRAALIKSEGVQGVAVDSEAPGLISMKVTYAGEAVSLIDKLSNFFPKKYDIQEKLLPSGATEVDITPKPLSPA